MRSRMCASRHGSPTARCASSPMRRGSTARSRSCLSEQGGTGVKVSAAIFEINPTHPLIAALGQKAKTGGVTRRDRRGGTAAARPGAYPRRRTGGRPPGFAKRLSTLMGKAMEFHRGRLMRPYLSARGGVHSFRHGAGVTRICIQLWRGLMPQGAAPMMWPDCASAAGRRSSSRRRKANSPWAGLNG